MRIYKNNFGWSAYCTNEFKGEKMSCYMPVSFKAGTEPSGEKENINVTKFFMSCYHGKNGVQPKMIITEYVVVKSEDEFNEVAEKVEKRVKEKAIDLDGDALPFY